jgi:hypothetical protein
MDAKEQYFNEKTKRRERKRKNVRKIRKMRVRKVISKQHLSTSCCSINHRAMKTWRYGSMHS